MLYGKENRDEAEFLEPIFGSESEQVDLPKYKLAQQSIEPRVAYQLVQDEMLDEGNARLNLATFCQTYMEPEAVKLMSQTVEKNAIDKSEYPRTTEIENRCVNMIADLWNASEKEKFMGTFIMCWLTITYSHIFFLTPIYMHFFRNYVIFVIFLVY